MRPSSARSDIALPRLGCAALAAPGMDVASTRFAPSEVTMAHSTIPAARFLRSFWGCPPFAAITGWRTSSRRLRRGDGGGISPRSPRSRGCGNPTRRVDNTIAGWSAPGPTYAWVGGVFWNPSLGPTATVSHRRSSARCRRSLPHISTRSWSNAKLFAGGCAVQAARIAGTRCGAGASAGA